MGKKGKKERCLGISKISLKQNIDIISLITGFTVEEIQKLREMIFCVDFSIYFT